jgi:hypothetical protein
MVRWASDEDLVTARDAAQRSHQEAGFVPAEFFARAGIEADLANYTARGTD